MGQTQVRRAVVVFARAPSEERKAKPIAAAVPWRSGAPGDPGAARRVEDVHRALLENALRVALGVPDADVLLVTTGDLSESRTLARAARGERIEILPQRGKTFAERIELAVEDSFARGYGEVLLIGADTPELQTPALEASFAALASATQAHPRAVIGRATDGGYYLLGLSRFSREVFREIEFGTGAVATQTLEALGRGGFFVTHLAALPDIDDARGLVAAIARLKASAAPDSISLARVLVSALDDLDSPPQEDREMSANAPVILVARGPPRD